MDTPSYRDAWMHLKTQKKSTDSILNALQLLQVRESTPISRHADEGGTRQLVSGVVDDNDDDGSDDDDDVDDDNVDDDDGGNNYGDDDDGVSDDMLDTLGLKSESNCLLWVGKSPVANMLYRGGVWQITSPKTKSFGIVTDFKVLFLTERMYLI